MVFRHRMEKAFDKLEQMVLPPSGGANVGILPRRSVIFEWIHMQEEVRFTQPTTKLVEVLLAIPAPPEKIPLKNLSFFGPKLNDSQKGRQIHVEIVGSRMYPRLSRYYTRLSRGEVQSHREDPYFDRGYVSKLTTAVELTILLPLKLNGNLGRSRRGR